jgi:hypothetical protein
MIQTSGGRFLERLLTVASTLAYREVGCEGVARLAPLQNGSGGVGQQSIAQVSHFVFFRQECVN